MIKRKAMGPKKEKREISVDTKPKDSLADEPLNTETWKCVVMMGVERSFFDTYAMKEFIEESVTGRRQEVSVIDYETLVVKILNDFINGELPYKYKFLLNFSTVFQEAAEFFKNKTDIPAPILVKIVKALLLHIKDESLMRLQEHVDRSTDPIKAMMDRPIYFSDSDKRKDVSKKGGNGLKVRPPSICKQDTKLLKRGERAKDDQCIDDAPRNAYFQHYVLLAGFYNPEFPMELIKSGIPLHGVLCVDTSKSGAKWDTSGTLGRVSRRNTETKARDIQNFWDVFLKKLWDPNHSSFFRDTVFQMYTPRKLKTEKNFLRQFLYKEISYLMYDLSDLKRQLNNYLSHIHLWNVKQRESDQVRFFLGPDAYPNECITVPIMLQCIINSVCHSQVENDDQLTIFSDSVDDGVDSHESINRIPSSLQAAHGSCFVGQDWETHLEQKEDINLLSIFYKIKELDVLYDLERKSLRVVESDKMFSDSQNSDQGCDFPQQKQDCGENMEKALLASDTMFHMLWKKYKVSETEVYPVDYCLYASLMTKIVCSYQQTSEGSSTTTSASYSSGKKNSSFELIENLGAEMRKPHFTVTDGSRSIIKCIPYNLISTSRDFFCPDEFKVVSPEKLKASSAPQFRVTPALQVKTLFASEVMSSENLKNPYTSLKGFVKECLFAKTNDFDCIEFLSKTKLLEEEKTLWINYNCVDHMYCLFSDCILLMLHNRKDGQNFQHETFNQKLRTTVGLRDFYDYVQEDESEWLTLQEESYQAKVFLSNKVLESNSLRDYSDSDFWLVDSLKYNVLGRRKTTVRSGGEIRIAYSSLEKMMKPILKSFENLGLEEVDLEGYDLSDMAVQYSGLKTVYYSEDCSVAVQLIERLYGKQELGVHVTQASHTLHLYSYVCPEPHISDPFTFHVHYKNGIIIAFSRRFLETHVTLPDLKEMTDRSSGSKTKRNTPESALDNVTPRVTMFKDDDFWYDMSASFPNGLCIRTVRKFFEPCFIKQFYVGRRKATGPERSRLFLPNGEVVKIMNDDTVQILKPNSLIVTAKLNDLMTDDNGKPTFFRYEFVSAEGVLKDVQDNVVKSTHRYQVFQNKDSSSNRIFFRRRDGTNYLLQDNGSFCVEFKDGTKMMSSVFLQNNRTSHEQSGRHLEEDFVFVHTEVVAEHPEYATTIYNSATRRWRILLPSDSCIIADSMGFYSVQVDKMTVLKLEGNRINLSHVAPDGQVKCCFTSNLSVFNVNEEGVYCHLRDHNGKVFIVEKNSNSYVLNTDDCEKVSQVAVETTDNSSDGDYSEFVTSTDLQISPSSCYKQSNRLIRENKYVVIRRDLSGMEILHVEDLVKVFRKREKGSLLFTQDLPGTENRCFVLISPVVKKTLKKWRVNTILPSPIFERNLDKKTASSTYGTEFPPNWLHPFPKKRKKFVVPEPLTCRVFMETKKTKLSPPVGSLDCYFCDVDEVTETKYTKIPPDGVDAYLRRLANDNQNILKEMYSLVAYSIINEKKKLSIHDTENLRRYLEISKHCRMMNEYYKKCIRFHIIPNYFHHPRGMAWLILNDLIMGMELTRPIQKKSLVPSEPVPELPPRPVVIRAKTFSNEELEYDLSDAERWSYSDLSCRSDLSAKTAPAILRTVNIRCTVKAVKNYSSSPEVKIPNAASVPAIKEDELVPPRICEFKKDDIEKLEKQKRAKSAKPPLTLDDLMHLGFV